MVYLILFICSLLLSLAVFIFPDWIKQGLHFLVKSGLTFIIGISEVGVALITLYFRDGVQEKWLAVIIGILLFVDGIFYLAAPGTIEKIIDRYLAEEPNALRLYGYMLAFLSVCFLILWI